IWKAVYSSYNKDLRGLLQRFLSYPGRRAGCRRRLWRSALSSGGAGPAARDDGERALLLRPLSSSYMVAGPHPGPDIEQAVLPSHGTGLGADHRTTRARDLRPGAGTLGRRVARGACCRDAGRPRTTSVLRG